LTGGGTMTSRGVFVTIFITAAFGVTSYGRTPQPPAKAPVKAAAVAAPAADTKDVKPPGNEDCLACHDDDSLKRANGAPVTVHKAAFDMSVHAPLGCVDCHTDLAKAELPHN